LETPLPLLLESTDLDKAALDALAGGKAVSSVPAGYRARFCRSPGHHAFLVKQVGRRNAEETTRSHDARIGRQGNESNRPELSFTGLFLAAKNLWLAAGPKSKRPVSRAGQGNAAAAPYASRL
jgi:hypothetical protein